MHYIQELQTVCTKQRLNVKFDAFLGDSSDGADW